MNWKEQEKHSIATPSTRLNIPIYALIYKLSPKKSPEHVLRLRLQYTFRGASRLGDAVSWL